MIKLAPDPISQSHIHRHITGAFAAFRKT